MNRIAVHKYRDLIKKHSFGDNLTIKLLFQEHRENLLRTVEKEKERELKKEENLKRLKEEQALNELLLEQRNKALNVGS